MEEKVQRLSEGMDFLEEACGYGEPLEFSEINESNISESDISKPSKYKVLGRCSGNFQPIGTFSRNKRLYSEDLWPTVLKEEELQSRLAHRGVFGCLGHADKLVDDRDLQEGKVSHIVTKLEVRKDANGKPFLYGELEILDTPAGRILKAMYEGGANLYVSSRAAGKLFPVPGQDYALIKPEQYRFHCFDIVCRPGFLQAKPVYEEVTDMSASTVSPVTESKEPNKECEYRKAEYEKANDAHTELKAKTGDYNAETPEVKKSLEGVMKAHADLEKARKDANEISEESEIQQIKGQIDKLAKIIEKVVDDVYEPVEEEVQKQPIAEPQDTTDVGKPEELKGETKLTEENKAALISMCALLPELNVSEETLDTILDAIKDEIKE